MFPAKFPYRHSLILGPGRLEVCPPIQLRIQNEGKSNDDMVSEFNLFFYDLIGNIYYGPFLEH